MFFGPWVGLALLGQVADRPVIANVPLLVHSHNDYLRPRPVTEALNAGACSLEVDVFPVEGQLLVGHDRQDLRADRDLRRVTLVPLAEWLTRHARPHDREGDGVTQPEVWLLIDVKSDGPDAFALLRGLAPEFPAVFESSRVGVVLSGALASGAGRAVIKRNPAPWARIDGRQVDLDRTEDLLAPTPWISESWMGTFRWLGVGTFPEAERRQLVDWVRRAHRHGRRVRFWGAPDVAAVWQAQARAGVDLINTDRPALAVEAIRGIRREVRP